VAERIRALDAKLDAAALELRTEEMTLSPSLTRRYFEKVRPADERIPFYLLRFYLSQSEVDENMLDKVDYLATVAAAGSPDPVAPAALSREEIRALFDRLLAGAAPTPINDEVAPEIARAFDELASQIGATTEFAHLAGEGQLEALRTLKRRAARGLAHPEILTAVVSCNLTARAVFRCLYEKEERALRAASAALKVLGQGEPEPREKMGNVADEKRPVREDPASGASSRRWRTRRERIRRAWPTSISRPGRERETALRWIASAPLSRSESAVLSAAALRVKAESETEAARGRQGSEVPPALLREARATLSHVSELDRTFCERVGIPGL
jgi:hypothetical protein